MSKKKSGSEMVLGCRMSQEEFEKWARRLELSPAAKALIQGIRSSQPTRKVRGGASNVHGVYPSRKMGCTIQFESHTLELPYIYRWEADPNVLEFYDQPDRVQLNYLREKKRISFLSTPDFFILWKDRAGWVEVKPEEKLKKMHAADPNRICPDLGEKWLCPPGQLYAAEFGLFYDIVSNKDLNPVAISNFEFLHDYRDHPLPETKLVRLAQCVVRDKPGITLAELQELIDCSRDQVFTLIAREAIWGDLENDRLSKASSFRLFPSMNTKEKHPKTSVINSKTFSADLGALFSWHGTQYQVVNRHPDGMSVQAANGPIVEMKASDFARFFRTGAIKPIQVAGTTAVTEVKKKAPFLDSVLFNFREFLKGRIFFRVEIHTSGPTGHGADTNN